MVNPEHFYKDPDWLWDMYWLEYNMTTDAMAQIAGCSRWTVEHYMKHYDIPRRSMSEKQRLAWSDADNRREELSVRSIHMMRELWNEEWFRARMSGKGHYNWKDGSTLEDYPNDWTPEFREAIRKRDDYKCILCGVLENGRMHSVHHINYEKEDTCVDNCMTLCNSCHGMTNTNRDYWWQKLTLLMYGIRRTPL